MNPTTRYICIHGHFYQPPRENPWLEAIEIQDSAHPWHDWNQRIAEECYTPNSQARILDRENRITDIINNYQHISFNFGPTLLSWLAEHAPETYDRIIQADLMSRKMRSGHGNALAQPYNHMIMPLASTRDRITQTVWGIEDFRRRFGRDPEGMWLPETAVDLETLDIMAQHGIRFTILAPRQASRFRASPSEDWVDVDGDSVDPTRPYLCRLPNGRSIALFFYDGPISRAIAFEGLLGSGEAFKNRLLQGFSDQRPWSQLVHVATDGESYGHHHRFGEMALAYALDCLRRDPGVRLTNYAEFLDNFPPTADAEIVENSSWSCAHGVKRWAEDCGCRVEDKPGWNQAWRGPLRGSLDIVRDRVDALFEEKGPALFKDPWAARDAYIELILNDHATLPNFLAEHCARDLDPGERLAALNLLEMQRNRMLMYTSCGWFFDDISGIESLQVLKYAQRVLQLASPLDADLTPYFLAELSRAVSNKRPRLNGAELFEQRVMPLVTDLAKVAAHVTISSVFRDFPIEGRLYCYDIKLADSVREDFGERQLLIRHMSVSNTITTETRDLVAAMLYFGGVDFRCSVKHFDDSDAYDALKADLVECCARQSSTDLIRKMDAHFPGEYFALHDLFVEQRSDIISMVTRNMYDEQATLFENFYRKNREFAVLISEEGVPLPDTFLAAARFTLNRSFPTELDRLTRGFFPDELESILEEARFWKIDLDIRSAEKLISRRILELVRRLEHAPKDEDIPEEIFRFLDLCHELEIPTRLGAAQIDFFRILRSLHAQDPAKLPPRFPELAERLSVRIPPA